MSPLVLTPDPAELNAASEELGRSGAEMQGLARRAAELLAPTEPNPLSGVTYRSLLCAQRVRGPGFLPAEVAIFAGLGLACAAKAERVTARKSSPPNPAAGLANRAAVARWGAAHRANWTAALERPMEADVCDSTPPMDLGNPASTAAGPLVLPSAAALPPSPPLHSLSGQQHRGPGNATGLGQADGKSSSSGAALFAFEAPEANKKLLFTDDP